MRGSTGGSEALRDQTQRWFGIIDFYQSWPMITDHWSLIIPVTIIIVINIITTLITQERIERKKKCADADSDWRKSRRRGSGWSENDENCFFLWELGGESQSTRWEELRLFCWKSCWWLVTVVTVGAGKLVVHYLSPNSPPIILHNRRWSFIAIQGNVIWSWRSCFCWFCANFFKIGYIGQKSQES